MICIMKLLSIRVCVCTKELAFEYHALAGLVLVISTVEQLSGWELVQWGANPLEIYWRLKLGGGSLCLEN